MHGNDQPLVSVLMNCFNGEKFLKDAIDSIYAQSYQNFEILFVDNCSQDASAEIARSYDDRLRYLKTQNNVPLGEARNWAMQFVKGKYLAFLDVDDLWLPNKLMVQVSAMQANADFVFAYSGFHYMDESSSVTGVKYPKSRSGNVFPALLKHYDVNQQTLLIRFDSSYCRFSEQHMYSPDYNLVMKLAARYKAHVTVDSLVKYRKYSSSLANKLVHRWGHETQLTLDEIFKDQPELRIQYSKAYHLAYAKAAYYKAVYCFDQHDPKGARVVLRPYCFKSFMYFLLYALSLWPAALWRLVHRKLNKYPYT
jgi:glycosyltransferase involved in cell wall biosynthesis